MKKYDLDRLRSEKLAKTILLCSAAFLTVIIIALIIFMGQQGLQTLLDQGGDYAFAVTSYAFPIQRAVRITQAGRVQMFDPAQFTTRSQDLEEAYHDAGQFYWGKADAWLQAAPIFSERSAPVMLPRHRVQDIDTPEDWVRAELMFKLLASTGGEH